MLLAARGARATEGGTEAITDPARVEALRSKAGRIQLKALVAALIYAIALVVVSVLIPWRLPTM